MAKFDIINVVKIAGVALGIAGTIATSWADHKGNEKAIKKLVKDSLKK